MTKDAWLDRHLYDAFLSVHQRKLDGSIEIAIDFRGQGKLAISVLGVIC